MKILFVTWDGPQTSYIESLFLPIFNRLLEHNIFVQVLQFSWATTEILEERKKTCADLGINFNYIKINAKYRLFSSVFSLFKGCIYINNLKNLDFIMPRALTASLISLIGKPANVKMIFDADGLPADERVDFANLSNDGFIYKAYRYLERKMLLKSDKVLVRSQEAKNILSARAGAGFKPQKITVITNGKDSNQFCIKDEDRVLLRKKLKIEDEDFVIGYIGSLGKQYCIDEMIMFYQYMKERVHNVKFICMTGSPDIMRTRCREKKVDLNDFSIFRCQPDDAPGYLNACDIGIALREPSFSMKGVFPIKISEYLLCGLPIVATKGIGDTEKLINSEVGVLINNDKKSIEMAADEIYHRLTTEYYSRIQIREFSKTAFSLDTTINSYVQAITS